MGLGGVDHAQATGNHDGLVVAALHGVHIAGNRLLVFAEVAQQVGSAKLVVERGTTQRALGHDLQRAGDVLGLAKVTAPEFGDGESRQTGLGLGAPARGAFIADLAARASGSAWEWRDGRGVVVGFHLHQDVVRFTMLFIAGCAYSTGARGGFGDKPFHQNAFHDRGVVRVRHQHVLWVSLVRMADHAEHALVLRHAVYRELGIEDLVAAVLAVGLGKHHQLHVGRVAPQVGEGVDQVVNFVAGQGQTKTRVGFHQCGLTALKHIHMVHWRGLQGTEQGQSLRALQHGALSHAVMQQGCDLLQLFGTQRGLAQQCALEGQAVLHQPFDAVHGQATVVRNIRGFGCPWRNSAKTR